MIKKADALARAYKKGLISEEAAGQVAKELGLRGRFLKRLGQGSEGVAQLRTHPKEGLAVAKIYNVANDRNFWASSFDEKLKIYKRTKGDPRFARYLGKEPGKFITYHEYVRPSSNFKEIANWLRTLSPSLTGKSLHRSAGTHLKDLKPANVINGKIIDFLPEYFPTKKDIENNAKIRSKFKEGLNEAVKSILQHPAPDPKIVEYAAYRNGSPPTFDNPPKTTRKYPMFRFPKKTIKALAALSLLGGGAYYLNKRREKNAA